MLVSKISTDFKAITLKNKEEYKEIRAKELKATGYQKDELKRCEIWIDLNSMKEYFDAAGAEIAASTHPVPRFITSLLQYGGH